MSDRNQDRVRIVADELRAYFESNPNAADTLEGIARWWHERARYEETRRTVSAALEYLVSEGEIRSRHTPHGEIIYYRAGRGSEG